MQFGGLAMTSRAKASCLSASLVLDPSGESTSVALEPSVVVVRNRAGHASDSGTLTVQVAAVSYQYGQQTGQCAL